MAELTDLTWKTGFQYDLCLKTFGGALYFAPITNVHRVLDIGTGLGSNSSMTDTSVETRC